jgi:hypothetical protein
VFNFDDIFFKNQEICDKIFPQLLRLESGENLPENKKPTGSEPSSEDWQLCGGTLPLSIA